MNKEFYTMEEMKKKWAEEEAYRLEHKLFAFFEDVRDLFRYTIPRVTNDWKWEVVWAWQRVFKGYDCRAIWNLDSYLTDIALPVLKHYRNHKFGYPIIRIEDPENPFKIDNKADEKAWNDELDKMIRSFEIMKDEENTNFENYEEHQKVIQEGLQSFALHYQRLWD